MKFVDDMKRFSISSLVLLLMVLGLVANSITQHYSINAMTKTSSHQYRSIMYSHVQVMNRILEVNKGKDVGLLLSEPDSWFDALKKAINNNPKKANILKLIALKSTDESGDECFKVYCNPVNDDIEPYEVFYFYFKGTECVKIRRQALLPW